MNLFLRIDNNLVAIIISLFFLIYIIKHFDRKDLKNKAFIILFTINILELTIETLTCIINRQPYLWLIPITISLHILLFTLAPIATYLWYVFIDFWINNKNGYNFRKDTLLLLPAIISGLVVLISPITKAVFYITSDNIYKRGSLFFLPECVTYFYLIYNFVYVYRNKEKLNKIEYLPLLLFGIFPAVGGIIQALFYGLLLTWSCAAFSIILLYVYLRQQMMQLDSLTGAWTREKLYMNIQNKINQNFEKSFAIVFIDLDNFKRINDMYGHNEGDKALKNFVKAASSQLGRDDSVTRYGGDEFILLLNVNNREDIENVMNRIALTIDAYNKSSNSMYDLEYSYGYEIYDFKLGLNAEEYVKRVDKLMYEAKKNKKRYRN